jgi:hypothetical protein
VACGGKKAGDVATTCEADCVVAWWSSDPPGRCDTFCALTPQPRECAETDCEALDFRRFEVDGTYRLATATHSPGTRSVTILAFFPERTWSIEPECLLSLGSSDSAQPFSCDAEQIDREQGTDFARSPQPLVEALEAIDADSCPCEITY